MHWKSWFSSRKWNLVIAHSYNRTALTHTRRLSDCGEANWNCRKLLAIHPHTAQKAWLKRRQNKNETGQITSMRYFKVQILFEYNKQKGTSRVNTIHWAGPRCYSFSSSDKAPSIAVHRFCRFFISAFIFRTCNKTVVVVHVCVCVSVFGSFFLLLLYFSFVRLVAQQLKRIDDLYLLGKACVFCVCFCFW